MAQLTLYRSNQPGWLPSLSAASGYNALSIPANWRAVNFLANNLSSFPRSVHLNGSPTDHPLNKRLKRKPNNYQNATQFWRSFFFAAVDEDNGYARISRSPTGDVTFHNLCANDVTPFRCTLPDIGTQQFYMVKGLTDGPFKDDQGNPIPVLHSADVLHISKISRDGMVGVQTNWLFTDIYQRARTIDRYTTMFLVSGTHVKGSVEIPDGATEEKIAQIVDTINRYRGAESADDVMVLTGGATLKNGTISPVDSQLVEQSSVTTKQIGQIHGIHPWYLYDDKDGKYNATPDAAAIELVKFTFRSWIDQTEDELTTKLLTDSEQDAGYEIRLDIHDLQRGDPNALTTTLVGAVNAGIKTANEARYELDLPPDADPKSNTLKTLGDTTPQAQRLPAPAAPSDTSDPSTTSPDVSQTQPEALSALRPIIAASCARIEDKTVKAFAAKQGKPQAERTAWSNVFADTQARMVAEMLEPVAAAITVIGGAELPVEKIAARYGGEIKRRASENATGEPTPLIQIVTEVMESQNEK